MEYPGRIIKIGEADTTLVATIYAGLSAKGYVIAPPPTRYDGKFAALVKLFQTQNVSRGGQPLVVDGEIGPLTWRTIFGGESTNPAPAGLAGAALGKALSQVGVREHPVGSNDGPEVRAYLASVGLPPRLFWCMAFVYWCFDRAARDAGIGNPCPKTGSVMTAWNRVNSRSPQHIITRSAAIANPSLVKSGQVFILDYGRGMGHTGFVKNANGGSLTTIEGNTNNDGSNNGIGVFELNRRSVMNKNLKGFLDFT